MGVMSFCANDRFEGECDFGNKLIATPEAMLAKQMEMC